MPWNPPARQSIGVTGEGTVQGLRSLSGEILSVIPGEGPGSGRVVRRDAIRDVAQELVPLDEQGRPVE